ncbi:MAG: hypothetical protein ACI4HN_02255 [Ruminococcus sp.]
MKKLLAIVLSVAILMLSLCACGAQSEQTGSSQKENNDKSSQQIVTTEEVTTQPATEPDYENTNFIAQTPQGKPNYTIEEISFEEAAESSGYSITDSKFRISNIYIENKYIVIKILYSDYNSTDFCAYNVIYDLDGNMVANISNIALEEGCRKSGQIRGIYGDFSVLCISPAIFEDRYALYNLKTKEIKYLQYDYASLKNGIIIVASENPEKEYSYKYGALDLDLNEIIPVEYDELKLASPELFIAKNDEKYGIVDFGNQVIADFKYKAIQSFTGIDDSISRNYSSLMDFEKNINKYTLAIDENDKTVLIDKKGNVSSIDFDISESNLQDGRRLSQYQDRIFIKHSDSKIISDLEGKELTSNSSYYGFINGFCITIDSVGYYGLIDTNGNTVYSVSEDEEYQGAEIFPVDQNGFFLISYYLNSGLRKNKILDLSGNDVYASKEEENIISPIGNGVFAKLEGNTYSVFKVTAN